MRLKILSLLSALLLVAACATDAEDTAGKSGSGAGSGGAGAGAVAVEPGTVQDFIVNVGDRVFFDFDKSTLSAKSQETLDKQAAWLTRISAATIMVEGHCDERGTREYNLALGARRAAAARDFLVSLGVAGNRMETVSYGKERPLDPRANEEAWSVNRNAHSQIVSGAVS